MSCIFELPIRIVWPGSDTANTGIRAIIFIIILTYVCHAKKQWIYLVNRSYVRIFDVDVRNGAIQESTKDTRVAMSSRSIFDLDQFPVYASRLPRIDQSLHPLSPVKVFLCLGRKVLLVDFLRLCIVLLLILQLLDKRSNDKADIIFFLLINGARSRGLTSGCTFYRIEEYPHTFLIQH